MKTNNLSRIVTLLVIVLVVVFASSCNRGYGCPTNFSLDILRDAVQAVFALIR